MRYAKQTIQHLANTPTTRQGGFTLIKIMVIIAVVGILAALLVSKIRSHYPDQERYAKAIQDIHENRLQEHHKLHLPD